MPRPHRLADALKAHGLAHPGTREDHPWGETVLKVKDKVFLFLGREDEDALRFSVKLPHTGPRWLDQPCAEPTGYGLGKSGWVTFTFGAHDAPPQAELFALLDESYRAVAPKKLSAALDGKASAPARAAARKPRARPKA